MGERAESVFLNIRNKSSNMIGKVKKRMNDIKAQIRAFLSKYIKTNQFDDNDHLFKKGYISSLLAMELVVFVENTFSIKIGNEDLRLDNFKSVTAIEQLVNRKTGK